MQFARSSTRGSGPARLGRLAALLVAVGVVGSACTASGSSAPQTVTVSTVAGAATTGAAGASGSVAAGSGAAGSGAAGSGAAGSGGAGSTAGGAAPVGSGAAPSSVAASGAAASSAPASSAVALPVAAVTGSPAIGTTTVAPADPIKVSVAQGKITELSLTSPAGKALKGAISADGTSWTLGEVLGFDKTYKLAGSATGTDGKAVPITGTYTTIKPKTEVRTTISPGDGKVVGVATSVIVSFGTEPADRASIAQHISITTTPKVEGAWVWVQHDDGQWALDFRTKQYWPANTKVHVEANVYGLKFADGAYGKSDITTDFTIGRSQIVKADVNSHFLQVFRGGALVASYPASYGKGDTPDKITRSGVHVVNDMKAETTMSNPKYGYVNQLEHWAVRISDNGEFIHANPNTVGDQGNTNVSHGCVNLSLADAEAYFKSALMGDPVEVTGTTINLSAADGDLFDWTYSWAQWQDLSVKTADA